MRICEITSYIESIAPLAWQEDYDNAGLICGNSGADVNSALVTLDCTEEVLDEAIAAGIKLIIAHHPIVFGGLKKITGKTYIERVLIKAIKNDIAIYTAHTNLDNAPKGVNARIGEMLGLVNTRILAPKAGLFRKLITFVPLTHAEALREALFGAGAGHIGKYDCCSFSTQGTGSFRGLDGSIPFVGEKGRLHSEQELKIETIYPVSLEKQVIGALLMAHPYEEVAYDLLPLANEYAGIGSGLIGELPGEEEEQKFLERLKKVMQCGSVRHTRLLGKGIKKVALCGGSGSFLLGDAISAGAQVFISADFKYHQFFDAENKIVIADIGHYETEQFTKHLFYDLLTQKFPIFAVHLSKMNTNPINYI
jgi:dinuclear metal center YbgI/SA1388 family protein